jgi:endonuclease-8
MPEGDTIHRTAAALRTALVGRPLTRFDAPRLFGPRPTLGRVVELVESHGKHLEIMWDDGLVLHTHMRLTGSWHLYRAGEGWRKPDTQVRVVIQVPEWVAVCFNAPVVETYREFDVHRHPGFGRLGPDLITASAEDLDLCARRMCEYPEPEAMVAEVLLDQHVACGVGNVYRSEVLWACELSPFAPVSALQQADCVQLINAAARMLRANLRQSHRVVQPDVRGGLAVYGRIGQRCARCGDTVKMRRVGEYQRVVYFCPGCQSRLGPPLDPTPPGMPREMDPHPAASKFLSELPWRRNDPMAG